MPFCQTMHYVLSCTDCGLPVHLRTSDPPCGFSLGDIHRPWLHSLVCPISKLSTHTIEISHFNRKPFKSCPPNSFPSGDSQEVFESFDRIQAPKLKTSRIPCFFSAYVNPRNPFPLLPNYGSIRSSPSSPSLIRVIILQDTLAQLSAHALRWLGVAENERLLSKVTAISWRVSVSPPNHRPIFHAMRWAMA